jgi:hypothetical protein
MAPESGVDGRQTGLARRVFEGGAVLLIVTVLVMTPSVMGLGREGRPSAKPAVLDSLAAGEVLRERNRSE